MGLAVCHSQRQCRLRFASAVRVFVLFLLLRIGEATNPGPDDVFVLGAANPSGLRSKAPYVASHMVWAFSETHLCSKDVGSLNAGLKFAGSPFQPFLGGFPVPSSKSNAGTWKGVGVLSRTPVRRLPHDWPDEVSQSSRVLAFTTLLDDAWLTGGVVYGEPESHLYPNRLQHTEALLQSVIGSVCFLATGPRFVAGDWNVLNHELPAFQMLEQAGFRDLQDLAFDRWAVPPQATCKHRTRKDFCYISAELQALLVDVQVVWDVWPDHALLQGSFQRLKQCIPRDVWRSPSAFPWPKDWCVPDDLWGSLEGSPTERYAQLWQKFEQTAEKALPFVPGRHTKGRAQTRKLSKVQIGKFPPVKLARNGDFNPHFHGASFRHAQWVRQTRRLQAYVRHVQVHGSESNVARDVWAAIVRASGFHGGFAGWWEACPSKVFDAVRSLPSCPPSLECAQRIFETMVIEVRLLENQLKSSSKQYARLRRARNPNLIFSDIKDHPKNGVDFLLRPLKASVVDLDHACNAIVVEPPQPWVTTRPVFCNGSELSVIHAEEDCLWVESLNNIGPGMSVSQLLSTGSKEDLACAFLDAWKQRWDKHRNVPHERWSVILQFARDHLPRQQLQWDSLTVESLAHAIARRKRTSAKGLDGVSVLDLQSLPRSALSSFCLMFSEAESSGVWPCQLLEGKVSCLATNDAPACVMDYRPITVLGLLYRIWGSHHARLGIRAIDSILPSTLYGSRPSRYAGQVCSQLLWAVEDSIAKDVSLSGIFADIQKAFNCLPRFVIFEVAALVGIPLRILTAWAGALSDLGRRFQLGPNLTKAAYSVTGLPEGDGLSCLGMVLIDMLFHAWHLAFFPLCQPVSYVDGWTLITTDPSAMAGMFQCLDRFTKELDLQLDLKKTCAWSVTARGRKLLRGQGFSLVSSCRSLGAHVQFSRKHTNSTQQERVSSLMPMWNRLRLSACAYEHKVRALRAGAWPRGLHAITATTVAANTFQSLRSGAMKGLCADGSGCNAFLHLGLVETPHTDPQFWSIVQTFRMVRDCGIEEVVHSVLWSMVQGNSGFASNGISATLLTRVQTLGWHVDRMMLVDDFRPFSLFDVAIDELVWRMQWAWLKVVAAKVQHRPGLKDLQCVDPVRTRLWLQKLSPSDRACYRKILNGAHITQDGKHYCQEIDEDTCPYCACSDSRFHRFWQCDAFTDCRSSVAHDLWVALPQLPECVVSYGWSLRPSTFEEWFSLLAAIDVPAVPSWSAPQSDIVHLFTDGSCYNPQYPDARFAAWAIVVADPGHVEEPILLDSGCLPGVRQTSMRAELFAVFRAVRFAVLHHVPIMIWCDCQAVVNRLRRLISGGSIRINSPNADLWLRISNDLALLRQGMVAITKVAAHRSLHSAQKVFEEWCFLHNRFSDHAANRANMMRPSQFWDLLDRHVRACQLVDRWNGSIQSVLLRISQTVLRAEAPRPADVAPAAPDTVPDWTPLPPLKALPHKAVRWYGDALVRKIVSWFWDTLHGATGPVQWVAMSQLYIDFASASGEIGPLKLRKWCDGSEFPLQGLVTRPFRLRVRWFGKVLREVLRHSGADVVSSYVRPVGTMIAMFSSCIAIPWPVERLELIDAWILTHTDAPYRRQSKAIDQLPVPQRNKGFPAVVFTSCD